MDEALVVGGSDPFPAWVEALAERHQRDLTFAEVRRGLVALSSLYVERRDRIGAGKALDGAGKRAAFALFYGPLHFLTSRHVVAALGATARGSIVDLGCGTGAAGAAWARASGTRIEAVDIDPWALEEARFTWRAIGVAGRAHRGRLEQASLPGAGAGVLAAYALNELDEAVRGPLLARFLDAAARGGRVLIIEPIAKRAAPWWPEWERAFTAAGGRADEWRFRTELPAIVRKLDRAAGLDHRELAARSLWLAE